MRVVELFGEGNGECAHQKSFCLLRLLLCVSRTSGIGASPRGRLFVREFRPFVSQLEVSITHHTRTGPTFKIQTPDE